MRDQWIKFTAPDGKELGAYTVRGTFPGEMKATRELLAAENGYQPEDIKVSLDPKSTKGRRTGA